MVTRQFLATLGSFRQRWRSVRVRIGLAFSLLAMALFLAIGVASGMHARQQSARETTAALQQLADRLAQRLDADMVARVREIDQLASLETLLEAEVPPVRWRALVERLQRSMPEYSWIGVAGVDGTVRAATQGLLEGRNVAQRPWFQGAMAGPLVGDVHEALLLASLLPAQPSGEPPRFVDVAAPLQREGRLVGVLGAHLSWNWAAERRREAMAILQPQQEAEIVLTDRRGQVLLGPSWPVPAPQAGEGAWWSAPAGTRRWNDGRAYLTAAVASRPMRDYPGMGWVVVVRQPVDTAFASADRLQRRLVLYGLAGALLFGAAGWWLAGRLTAPLRRVARDAVAVATPTTAAATPAAARDEVAQLASSLGTLIDGLRAREQELTTLNQELESRVQRRTASLEKANEDLRSFSASVSHDLRGPLVSMAMVLRQLVEADGPVLSPGSRRVLDLVVHECDRLGQLTDELLTLAMVEQRELQIAPVDHAALVRSVLDELQARSPTPLPPVERMPLPATPGDAVLLRQVWSNLLGNAIKFSQKVAQPRIVIGVRQDGDAVEFSVSDNGAGFDASQAERLFGMFQRLHAASDFPGSGVGLSIVRRVVHRHGGTVRAESAPGRGARFLFTLPRGPVPLASADWSRPSGGRAARSAALPVFGGSSR